MANLLLELLTTGQGFSPIEVKGGKMTHLVTAYHRKYVHLNRVSPEKCSPFKCYSKNLFICILVAFKSDFYPLFVLVKN